MNIQILIPVAVPILALAFTVTAAGQQLTCADRGIVVKKAFCVASHARCYHLVQSPVGLTQNQAKSLVARCKMDRRYQPVMATLQTKTIYDDVISRLGRAVLRGKEPEEHTWVGAGVDPRDGIVKWFDGTPIQFKLWGAWAKSKPDTPPDDAVVLHAGDPGKFSDESSRSKFTRILLETRR